MPSRLEPLGVAQQVEVRVASSGDDAEESRASGEVRLRSKDLELNYDSFRGRYGRQFVGLRFGSVEVPRGARIERAYLQFQADETDAGYLKVYIQGHNADSGKPFTGSIRNISQRARTSAKVRWILGEGWGKQGERGRKQRTPDLSSIVKEVTSREGWRSGNALVFILSSDKTTTRRVAESYDGDPEGAPTLVIEYQARTSPRASEQPPTPVILDTDLGIDVDDAGALAVLHTLADRGEADVLATVSNTHDPYAAAAVDTINTYYGRPDLPIGRNANEQQFPVATPWWRTHNPRFVRDLAERFPNDTNIADVPSAVSVYREALASQPDGSVAVISVGFLSNLSALLNSKPDRYSPLAGKALVKRKVKELVVMGGTYPRSSRDLYIKGASKGNIPPTAAMNVLDNWPTATTFAAGNVCGDVITGQTLASTTPESNPVREAYTLFYDQEGRGRNSWDLCAVLYAVRGFSDPDGRAYFALPALDEHFTVDEEGNSAWISPGNARHRRLTRAVSKEQMRALLEALLTTPPTH